jgi:hypothetical protein
MVLPPAAVVLIPEQELVVRSAFFDRKFHSRMPCSHACSLPASRRVTNQSSRVSIFLPVHTVNCVLTLKVALLQMQPNTTFVPVNATAALLAKADAFIRKAAAQGADVALLPELWSVGYEALFPCEQGIPQRDVYGACFSTEICTRGCHWFPCLLACSEHACDQWYSSRVFTPLTG